MPKMYAKTSSSSSFTAPSCALTTAFTAASLDAILPLIDAGPCGLQNTLRNSFFLSSVLSWFFIREFHPRYWCGIQGIGPVRKVSFGKSGRVSVLHRSSIPSSLRHRMSLVLPRFPPDSLHTPGPIVVSSVSDTRMFRNLFGGGRGARGFRPRHDRGGIHFLFPLVVGVVSGKLPCRVEGQRFQYM